MTPNFFFTVAVTGFAVMAAFFAVDKYHQDPEGEALGRLLLSMSKTQRRKLPEVVFKAEQQS